MHRLVDPRPPVQSDSTRSEDTPAGLGAWLDQQVANQLEIALARRLAAWRRDGNRPSADDVDALITSSARANAALVATMSLVPGPVGTLAVPAELWLLIRRDAALIADLALAHGVQRSLDATVFQELSPVKPRSLGRVASGLAGRHLSKRALRLLLGRALPVVGAVGAAWWAHRRTRDLGRRADRLFRSASWQGRPGPREVPAGPEIIEERAQVSNARHALHADLLRHLRQPSTAQLDRFDVLTRRWSETNGPLPGADEVLAASEDPQPNVPLLAEAMDPEDVLAELIAFGRLGSGLPLDWTYATGRAFGLDRSDVDALVAAS